VWENYCSPTNIALWITIVIHSVLLFFFFFLWIFFQICFCRFYRLIFGWLKFWLYNLFPFILLFYEVSMICRFDRLTRLALIYEFGGVSFFLIEFDFFFIIYLFFYIVKKIVSDKNYVIKLYKVHGLIHKFGWLIWLVSLASLIFFN